MKKYRSNRKGRRSFDTAIEYGTVAMVAKEKTRTARPAVRATLLHSQAVNRRLFKSTVLNARRHPERRTTPRCCAACSPAKRDTDKGRDSPHD
jgi:hypothetical protein